MMPLTPRDGSEVSVEVIGNDASGSGISTRRTEEQREYSGGASGLGLNSALRKAHRRSISFDIESSALNKFTDEQKRKERRRSEAKAAIELGNVINGRGPVLTDEDDDDDDVPINQTRQAAQHSFMLGQLPNASQPQFNMQSPMWLPQPGFSAAPLPAPNQFLSPDRKSVV